MEIWKDIKDFEGLYQVSNFGRVRSFYKGCRILSPGETRRGYLRVCLCKNGKRKSFLVHRLVAEAFLPNYFDYREINHID